jgi:hypothetical protein
VHTLAAVVPCVVLAVLVVSQLALALGAPLGRFAWGGQHKRELPAQLRIGSAVSIIVYALFGVVLLDRAGLADILPDTVSRVAAWVLFAYFGLGVVLNGISRSRPERLAMTPTTLVLAVCTLLVALG